MIKNILRIMVILMAVVAIKATQAKSDVNFHGTLYSISCIINNDKPVDILFGNVGVNKVDGVQYTQSIPLSMTCDEGYSGALLLTIAGNESGFDDSAVMTDAPGLAIRIMQGGEVIQVNKPFIITTGNLPVLTAVPVKDPQITLTGGEFHATATLIAEIE